MTGVILVAVICFMAAVVVAAVVLAVVAFMDVMTNCNSGGCRCRYDDAVKILLSLPNWIN